MTIKNKTPGIAGACHCTENFLICSCESITQRSSVQPLQERYPTPTTAQSKFIRDYRERLQDYADQTGNRQAIAAVECLTFVLVEGGQRP